MSILHQIIVMIVTLGVLVAFHEFGHFWVARRCGVKVLRFSIGFGHSLFSWRDKQNTEYVIAALPLGGYVKMLDEREEPVPDEEKQFAFNNKPVFQRIAIVSAGPLANFLLAIFVYWLVFLKGTLGLAPQIFSIEPGSPADQAGLTEKLEIVAVDGEATNTAQAVSMAFIKRIGETGHITVDALYPGTSTSSQYKIPIAGWLKNHADRVDAVADLGIGFYQPEIKPLIAEVMDDSAASEAGLQVGDLVTAVDGNPVEDWMQWVELIQSKAGETLMLDYTRNGESRQVAITPRPFEKNGETIGLVGVRVEVPPAPEHLLRRQSYNPFSAILPAVKRTWEASVFCLQSLKKMLFGEISYKQLSGPITIAKVASQQADSGIYPYLSLLALLSVSLGVLNLLPIPVLDGGHILFYSIEWIKGSPVSEKVQILAYQFGLFMVVSVMVLALVNDIGRL